MVALRVSDVDWIARTIHVDRKITESGSRFIEGPPKTKRSRRPVAVPAIAIEALSEHVRRFPSGPGSLIFASKTGQPIRRSVFYRFAWWPACESLGLARRDPRTRRLVVSFKAKNLRHTGATIAGELSGDPKLVQERLGHSSLAMVSRVYQGVFDRRQREVADQMDAVARAARERAADEMRMDADSGASS
jgi:integrase